MQGKSELAQQLEADACQGADPLLRTVLPHTRALCLAANQGEESGLRESAGSVCAGRARTAPLCMCGRLPTTAVFQNAGRPVAPASVRLAADQWPPGCLGYAFNLIRPRLKDSRPGLLYALVSGALAALLLSALSGFISNTLPACVVCRPHRLGACWCLRLWTRQPSTVNTRALCAAAACQTL
jgi:hypothetical protein